MCADCPFRKRTFIRLSRADAQRLIDFVREPRNVGICHASSKDCSGARRLFDGGEDVHASAEAMVRAHARSRRPIAGTLWGIE